MTLYATDLDGTLLNQKAVVSENSVRILNELLEQIALVADVDNMDDSDNKVILMTLHSAKGLEFDQVFAVFPQKDQSPLVRQARYIAATRALHELHMYEVEK